MSPASGRPEETLANGRGSCRDTAWLLVQTLRQLGFAARFCSGYLIQLAADIKPVDGPAGPQADFTDLHAWCEVYVPGAGWVGLDPTSGLFAGEGHIQLAAAPDPVSAAPITGLVEKAATEFTFEMKVARLAETPRVTRPYTEPQWRAINRMGALVDRALEAGAVRLTMGGEPSFVSATDRDAPEWKTEALGPAKRRIAGRLPRRLHALWSPGGALQYTQGKWYPGEQLPRWALYAHWRNDGEPVWRDPALLASDDETDNATAADARRFALRLAERLQVDPGCAIAAHEDIHYHPWREQRLPANVVVEDAKLKDPLDHARLARVFAQGLAADVGTVLPLRRIEAGGARRWQSGRWFLRSGPLFLIPGDSPIGYRLPPASLPWAPEEAIDAEPVRDPFAEGLALPPRRALCRGQGLAQRVVEQRQPEPGREEPEVVRTDLAVEPRGGMPHVFLPPVTRAEDWLDLVAAVEETAAEAGQRVFLEGYLPPYHPGLAHFSITPDPGVIEVNIHPALSWGELAGRTETLYEEAREVGLVAEKFNLDGRHVGTGGGNHVVPGGPTPAESPFLRRPDLLKSLVGFWHYHPSLSYLFSGQFIGPTSQHPRVDEARSDSLHELEIAFRRVWAVQETPLWLTDRLFRNLLIDVTGNTHRTEFCIDSSMTRQTRAGAAGSSSSAASRCPPTRG